MGTRASSSPRTRRSTSARSRHTDPERSARTVSAAAEQHLVVGLAAEASEPARDGDVGRGEDTAGAELGEQPRRADRVPDAVLGGEARAVRRSSPGPPGEQVGQGHDSAGGGDQRNTPQVVPSTTGVSGPHMPRRNR